MLSLDFKEVDVPIGVKAMALDPSGSCSLSATRSLETPKASLIVCQHSPLITRRLDLHGVWEVVQESIKTISNGNTVPCIPRDLSSDVLISNPDISLFIADSTVRLG